MKRICRAMLVTLALLAIAAPVQAQEAVELDASIGLQGYVMPYESATVSVRVRADVLFVGDLQVTAGGVSLFTPIEVPAGSTKDYAIDIPSIGPTGRALVRLFVDGADDHLVQESVTVLQPGERTLVGIFAAPGIESALVAAKSVPFGRPLEVLTLEAGELDGDLAPLAYLVLGEGSLAGAAPATVGSIGEWADAGGRLIGTAADIGAIDPQAAPGASLTDAASVVAYGAGELITVDTVGEFTDWGAMIRDIPPLSLSTNEFFPEMGFQMVEAASAGGESVTPGIPWLFAALAVYVALVGPINFLVLRRMGRSELAWVTIPAISLVMLGFLWLAGRSQLDGRVVTHASVIVQEDDTSRATSAMIVVAGEKGEHSLDVPAGWSLAPIDTSMMFGRASGVEASVRAAPQGGTRMGFELPSLGAATLTATWQPSVIPISASVAATEAGLTMDVRNDSQFEFWAWGFGQGSTATASIEPLVPAESGSLELRSNVGVFEGGSMIADAVMSRGGWDWDGERTWQVVWPLSETVMRQEGATIRAGAFFFGFTDDLVAEVLVDGGSEVAHGPTLLVIPLELPPAAAGASGAGDVVQITGADFVDSYQSGWFYASGADGIDLRFGVAPDAAGEAKVQRQGGHFPGVELFEVYNWQTRTFDVYPWLQSFPLAAHVSPVGEVMARVTFETSEFSDLDYPAGALQLSVETS